MCTEVTSSSTFDEECAAAGLDRGCDIKGANFTDNFQEKHDRQFKMNHIGD
jgi:hypothetical protein